MKYVLCGFGNFDEIGEYIPEGFSINVNRYKRCRVMKSWWSYVDNIRLLYYNDGVFRDDIIIAMNELKNIEKNNHIDCNDRVYDRGVELFKKLGIVLVLCNGKEYGGFIKYLEEKRGDVVYVDGWGLNDYLNMEQEILYNKRRKELLFYKNKGKIKE